MTREEYEQKYGIPAFSVEPTKRPTPTGQTDDKTTTQPAKKRGVLEEVVKRPLERLILEPGRRFGEALGSAIATPFVSEEKKNQMAAVSQQDRSLNVPFLGEFKTRGVKPGKEGAKQIAGETAETAAYLMPGAGKGASLASKSARGATTGYLFDVGSKTQAGAESPLTPGIGTAAGAILPLLGHVIGNFPKKMEAANMRMSPLEKSRLADKGKDMADFIAKKKLVGSPEVRYSKMNAMYNQMENKVGNVVKKSGVTYDKRAVLESIKRLPEEMADDPAGYAEATRTANRLMKFIQDKAPDKIPAETLHSYKKSLWKRAYSKSNTDVVNETYHAAASGFKQLLDDAIPGLRALNDEYSNIILAKRILFKAIGRPQVSTTGKLLGTAAGAGIGGAAGGGIGAGAGAIVGEKVAEHAFGTATRSAAGATVQSLQDLVSRIPVDKAGNLQLTQKGLLSLLEKLVR